MKANEHFFHVVLFIMLYKMVLTFNSVDENLVCDHSNTSYRAVLTYGTVCIVNTVNERPFILSIADLLLCLRMNPGTYHVLNYSKTFSLR